MDQRVRVVAIPIAQTDAIAVPIRLVQAQCNAVVVQAVAGHLGAPGRYPGVIVPTVAGAHAYSISIEVGRVHRGRIAVVVQAVADGLGVARIPTAVGVRAIPIAQTDAITVLIRLVAGGRVAVLVDPVARDLLARRRDRGVAIVAIPTAQAPAVAIRVGRIGAQGIAVVVDDVAVGLDVARKDRRVAVVAIQLTGRAVAVQIEAIDGARVAVVVDTIVTDFGSQRTDGRIRVVAVEAPTGGRREAVPVPVQTLLLAARGAAVSGQVVPIVAFLARVHSAVATAPFVALEEAGGGTPVTVDPVAVIALLEAVQDSVTAHLNMRAAWEDWCRHQYKDSQQHRILRVHDTLDTSFQ
jgi:hypothetical protein